MKARKGFTLIEMLVVIGIITVLMAASMAGFSSMTKTAEKTRARELVTNVATALTALYQREGAWPKRTLEGAKGDFKFDENAALPLAKKNYLSLSLTNDKSALTGYDKFGVVTPWAVAVLKSNGRNADKGTKVGSATIEDHILRYAIDTDGSGFVDVTPLNVRVRATACVWCCGKNGSFGKKDVIMSWTKGQEVRQ